MRYSRLILVLLLLISGISTTLVTSADTSEILIIYGSEDDRLEITSMLNEYTGTTVYIEAENVVSSDINGQDMIILTSTNEFSISDPVELALIDYAQSYQLVVITPYLDEFSGDSETILGIDSIEDTISSENSTLQWTISPVINFLNSSTSDNYSYYGVATKVQLENNVQLLADFTSVTGDNEETDELVFPFPAIWNTTDGTYVIPTGISETDSGQLQLSQTSDFISNLIADIIIATSNAISNTNPIEDDPDQNSNQVENTEDSLISSIPNLQLGLLAALITLLALLYSKIVGAINWLVRKGYGVLMFAVGAFYNIQDRTMSHSEVVTNTSRTEILEYLNHVGSFGAHLREIKSVTEMGSGSLLWHLQVLEDYNLIQKYSIDSYTIFVADSYTFDARLKEVELQLQSKYTLDLLEVLSNHAGDTLTLGEIENSSGTNRRALRRLLKKMASNDLVELEKYPEMSVNIIDRTKVKELYHSFNLRKSFSFERESPEISYLDSE